MVRPGAAFILSLCLIMSVGYAEGERDLAKANELFKQRDQGLNKIELARKIYLSLVKDPNTTLEIKKEALSKFARLAVFQFEVGREIYGTDHKQAVKVFETCIEATDYLSEKQGYPKTAEYVYARALCIGLWAANASKTKVLMKPKRFKELMNLIEYGQMHFKTFDGFGFSRIEAGVYCKSKFLSALNLYHPERAVELMDHVLEHGTDFYVSYSLKAEALLSINKIQDAQMTLTMGISELETRLRSNDIPENLIIENQIFLRNMKAQLSKLTKHN